MNGVFQSSLFFSAEHFYMVELSSLKTMEEIELSLRRSDNSVPNQSQIVLNSCWGLRVGQDYKRVRVRSTDQQSGLFIFNFTTTWNELKGRGFRRQEFVKCYYLVLASLFQLS